MNAMLLFVVILGQTSTATATLETALKVIHVSFSCSQEKTGESVRVQCKSGKSRCDQTSNWINASQRRDLNWTHERTVLVA